MEAHEFIVGHERVIAHFGLWPSFHDAEVFKLSLDRTQGKPSPTLDLHLRGWVTTSEVAPEGHYKLQGDAVLHFQFEGISEVHVEGFNGQNVISSLNLELAQAQDKQAQTVIKVELEHCYLFEASFTAQRAQLISITPYAK